MRSSYVSCQQPFSGAFMGRITKHNQVILRLNNDYPRIGSIKDIFEGKRRVCGGFKFSEHSEGIYNRLPSLQYVRRGQRCTWDGGGKGRWKTVKKKHD